MTTSPFYWLLTKQTRAKWLEAQEENLKAEFSGRFGSLREELEKQVNELVLKRSEVSSEREKLENLRIEVQRNVKDLNDLIQRNNDRKTELEKSNNELREQIRLIEAKASPDSVWVEAFSRGYEKAWETMWPLMADGLQKSKESIRSEAIEDTRKRLSAAIEQANEKIKVLSGTRSPSEVRSKIADFEKAVAESSDSTNAEKYRHYLAALNWVINGDNIRSHQ